MRWSRAVVLLAPAVRRLVAREVGAWGRMIGTAMPTYASGDGRQVCASVAATCRPERTWQQEPQAIRAFRPALIRKRYRLGLWLPGPPE